MKSKNPASNAQGFLLANQVQSMLRAGEPKPARRVELLEGLLRLEREAAAAEGLEPAPMLTTPGGLKIHGR